MLTDRTIIPFNNSGIIIKFPDIEILNLGNIKIYKYHDSSQPLVNFKINFKNGASSDIIPGTANFTMSMLQNGTKTSSTSEISEKFESIGASYFFNAYWDECAAGFSCLEQYFIQCLDVLADCIFNPAFSDLEIERQRQKILAMIMQNNSDPSYLAQFAFNMGVFKGHPYGNSRTGNAVEVNQITKNDITNYYSKLLTKSEVSIIVTGNFDNTAVDQLIKKYFESLSTNSPDNNIKFLTPEKSSHFILEKDDAMQTTLRIGKLSIDRNNPDYPAFQIINTIFGGYFLSRLNHVLRELKGLTYGIHSYLDTRKYGSAFVISTSINLDKTSESISDIFEISREIANNKIDEAELFRSVEFMTGSFARTLETPKQITGLIQTVDSYNLELNFMADFYNKIRTLTIDDLFEVQKKYFNPDDYLIVATGDSKFLAAELSKFGDFQIIKLD